MNKKNLILAVTFVIVITGILFTIIWLSKVRQSQLQPVIANKIEGQNSITEEQIPKQKIEDSNEMENATQVPERFSGAECYAKNVDGSDNLYELSKDFNLSDPTSKITYTNKEKGMSFELSMAKEDKNDFEFGSFVVIASVKPVNFGVLAADANHSNCNYMDFNKFFSVISGIKKDFSIMYLPYCIE